MTWNNSPCVVSLQKPERPRA